MVDCSHPAQLARFWTAVLDLRCDDPDSELTCLVELGADQLDDRRGSDHWVVMADPEGNEFCLLW